MRMRMRMRLQRRMETQKLIENQKGNRRLEMRLTSSKITKTSKDTGLPLFRHGFEKREREREGKRKKEEQKGEKKSANNPFESVDGRLRGDPVKPNTPNETADASLSLCHTSGTSDFSDTVRTDSGRSESDGGRTGPAKGTTGEKTKRCATRPHTRRNFLPPKRLGEESSTSKVLT